MKPQSALKHGGVILILFALVSVLTPPVMYAQEASPSPLAALKGSNAGIRRFVLDNGLICLVKEDHSAPVAAVQIWIGTGAMDEDEYLGAGLSHYVEHMAFKGTTNRDVGDITREINDVGGNINAYTAQDRTVFHTTLPARSWRVGLDVLADAVMNSTFPEDEWERERDVILREMAMGRDDPRREAGKLLWETAYRVHPYRVPIIGYEDVFKTMTRDDLVAFFRRHYVPDNMIVVVVGDVNADDVEKGIRETMSGFARRARKPTVRPAEPPQLAPRFARKTGAYNVSRFHVAFHTVSLDHPDAPALDVLASIVGAGRSSRLVNEIKERQRLVHAISAWSSTPRDAGLFGITATFEPSNESAALQAVEEEVKSWLDKPFSDEELEKARRMVLVGELGSLQTMEGQAYSFASGEFYAADPRFSERYLESVRRVTAEDLQNVVAKYLRPENQTLIILSPETTESEVGTTITAAVPNLQKTELPNGIPLIVREDHRLPFVYVCVAVRGGLLAETEKLNGVSQLMSDLLTRGTKSRSAEEIAATVEQIGASLSAFAGRNSFGLQAQCLAEDAKQIVELLAECLLESVFPEEELEKQRAIQIAGIRQQYERPFFVAEESLRELIFPQHPYRWSPLGSEQAVRELTRDDIVALHRRLVNTGNMAVSIFGDITRVKAEELTQRVLAAVPVGEAPDLSAPEPERNLPARTKKREPREQTIVLAGYPGVRIGDPRADALDVVDSALSGLSSDLGIEVREKRGLVYYVGSFVMPGLEPGMFVLYAGTQEDAADTVLELMDAETKRITENGLREDEIKRAQEELIAAHQMSLQNNAALAQTCALNELYGLGYDHAFSTEERLRALTADQIRNAAAFVFRPDRRAVSLVLPGREQAGEEKLP